MAPAGTPSAPEILLVEDNLDDTYLFLRVLKGEFPTLALSAVESAEAAERYLCAARDGTLGVPSAIFVDLNLPGQSGHELMRWIENAPHLKGTRLIVLSANIREPGRGRSEAGREVFYLPKPLTSDAVTRALA